ncbi:MAG: hypothetical protein AB1640_00290 [bacterium]
MHGRSFRFTILSAVFTFAGLTTMPAGARGVEILVEPAGARQAVSPLVFGNSVMCGGESMGFSQWIANQQQYDTAKRTWNYYLPYIQELGPTVIRYPHGLGANSFFWKDGIGPIESRNPDYGGEGIPQTFGTDEFLQYAEEVAAEAILVVNVSVAGARPGSVQDAADWVEYCNAPDDGSNPGGGTDWAALRAANGHKEPYGVKYWELGNEETFPGWENYADRVRSYSQAMKAIDPGIRIGVIGGGTGLDAYWQNADWLRYHQFMLESAGSAFDFFIHHSHMPAVSGHVDGLTFVRSGTSLEAPFEVEQEGDHSFQFLVEGACSRGECPRLSLWVDGALKGDWTLQAPLAALRTEAFRLLPGRHLVRLQVEKLPGKPLHVAQQLQLFRQWAGGSESAWVDLKDSLEWYKCLQGSWKTVEYFYNQIQPYTGGKPIFFTELNVQYQVCMQPPYLSKACTLRETLSLACIYNFFLGSGVPLANYWLLFQEQDGVGVLEGVAYDGETRESGRPDPHRRPSFHLLKAYRWNVLDFVVPAEVRGAPTFLSGPQTGLTIGYANQDFENDYLQALATVSKSGNRLSLFVVNLDPERGYDVPVDLKDFRPKSKVKVLSLTGPSPGANNEPEDCPSGDCVKTTQRTLTVPGSTFSYHFPKHSVTIFVFEKTGSDSIPPLPPTGLSGGPGDGAVRLTWNRNQEADLKGYNVYRSRCTEGPFLHRANSGPCAGTDFLDDSVDNGVTYAYAVRAVDNQGNESALSDKILVAPESGLGPPTLPPPPDGVDRTPPSAPVLLSVE